MVQTIEMFTFEICTLKIAESLYYVKWLHVLHSRNEMKSFSGFIKGFKTHRKNLVYAQKEGETFQHICALPYIISTV